MCCDSSYHSCFIGSAKADDESKIDSLPVCKRHCDFHSNKVSISKEKSDISATVYIKINLSIHAFNLSKYLTKKNKTTPDNHHLHQKTKWTLSHKTNDGITFNVNTQKNTNAAKYLHPNVLQYLINTKQPKLTKFMLDGIKKRPRTGCTRTSRSSTATKLRHAVDCCDE